MLNAMERSIIGTLLNWGVTNGWELWAEDEGVASQLGLPNAASTVGYKNYKTTLARLSETGLVIRTTEERKAHKALWSATEAGQLAWAEARTPSPTITGVDLDRYIGKKITGKNKVPREAWRALMVQVEAGELSVAFLRRK